MATNEVFSKDALCKVINANLPILRRCAGSDNIYLQRTAILMLMQFIEYVLKYKIQCAGTDKEYSFPLTHNIEKLYGKLTDGDQKCIEEHFCKLMKTRKSKNPDRKSKNPDRNPEYSESFDSIKKFAKRYKTSYQYWRYAMLGPNFNVNEHRKGNEQGYEKYFYLADTVTVFRALIKSTDMKINTSDIPNEDVLVVKILKERVR